MMTGCLPDQDLFSPSHVGSADQRDLCRASGPVILDLLSEEPYGLPKLPLGQLQEQEDGAQLVPEVPASAAAALILFSFITRDCFNDLRESTSA